MELKVTTLEGKEAGSVQLSDEIFGLEPRQDITVHVTRADGTTLDLVARCRIDTFNELEYYRAGGILHYVLRNLAA